MTVVGREDSLQFDRVVHLGTDAAAITLRGETASVPVARAFVRSLLAERTVDWATTKTALLLTSEVVTNAVMHAASAVEVRVLVTPGFVRVDVVDSGGGFPRVEDVGPDEERGRGLKIVSRLATHWGVALEDRQKSVWFEVGR